MALTLRSKITVRWTTNPADMGYDGRKSDWLSAPGETIGVRRAAQFAHELDQRVGQGVNRLIDYRHNGQPVSAAELRDVINLADAEIL